MKKRRRVGVGVDGPPGHTSFQYRQKEEPNTDLNHLSKALYKLQGQRVGVAGGLGILRTPNPLTRPLPLQHKGRKTESRAQLGHWREAPSGFQSPIHRPPQKKNTRKHQTNPPGRPLAPRGPQNRRPGHLLSWIFLAYSFPSSTQPPVPTPKPRSTAYPLGSGPPNRTRCPSGGGSPRAVPVTNLLL